MTNDPPTPALQLAELQTPEGTVLIQERRRQPRVPGTPRPAPTGTVQSYTNSPQMMGLGGLIIIGVLVASYTAKYDASLGHVGGALTVPAVGYWALQLFLARAALRLYDDVHNYTSLFDFVVNRAFRYLPAVIPGVLIGFLVASSVEIPGLRAEAGQLPANLLMLSDMIGVDTIDKSHWRLKIEIIQAVLVAAAWFGPAKRFLPGLLTVGLLVTAWSIDGEPARHNVLSVHGFLTSDGYLPLFVYGIALYHFTKDRSSRVWVAMMAASAALTFMSNTPAHGAIMVASLIALTLLALGHLRWLGAWRWLSHLGEIAFPIYVVHYVLGFAIIHKLEGLGLAPLAAILVASLVAIVAGKGLNAAFERPLQLRCGAFTRGLRNALGSSLPLSAPAQEVAAVSD